MSVSAFHRRPPGSPGGTGGQFAPGARGESAAELEPDPSCIPASNAHQLLADVDDLIEQRRADGSLTLSERDRLLKVSNRLNLYILTSAVPDGFGVSIMARSDDPDDQGRFDVALGTILEPDGSDVDWLTSADESWLNAGYLDYDGPHTDFDELRVDPHDPGSAISVDKVRGWFSAYAAQVGTSPVAAED